jgi:hypothetical protein
VRPLRLATAGRLRGRPAAGRGPAGTHELDRRCAQASCPAHRGTGGELARERRPGPLACAGSPPADRELEDAETAYDEEEAALPAAIGIGFTLSRLVAGDTDAIEFVEISPDGLAVQALVADEFGVPRLGPGAQAHWTDILPGLPADDDLRMYLLAGGVGDQAAGPSALAASVTAAAGKEIQRLAHAITDSLRRGRSAEAASSDAELTRPPLTQPDTVLVRRTQRWPALDAAAAKARATMRPVAEIFAPGPAPLSAILTEAVRRAPLRYDYCLVLAAIDQRNGTVRLKPSPLFAAGTTGQQRLIPTVDTPVTAAAAAAGRLLLPVVARRGDDPAGWPAVGAGVMDGTAVGTTRVRVRLEAPGHVSMSATPRLVSGDGVPGWPDILAGLPDRLPGLVVADVVLLAELGGPPDTVASRMNLLNSVVGGLDGAALKVAVVGYREHWDKYAAGLIVTCGPGDAADIGPLLTRRDLWRAVEIRDRHAAPLEDALEKIAQPDWAWRPGARHVLVVFASRPPHPRRVDDRGELRASPCQNTYDWQDTLDRLSREQAVECLAVLPEREAHAPAGDYAERAWAEFGKAGLFYAERSPAADLLRAIGIGQADDGARLPLALGAPDGWPTGGPGEEGGR